MEKKNKGESNSKNNVVITTDKTGKYSSRTTLSASYLLPFYQGYKNGKPPRLYAPV